MKIEEKAAAVKEVGPQNVILGTDLGQTGNPSPADGLQLFVTQLMKAGLTKDQITTTGREVPGKLLMGGRAAVVADFDLPRLGARLRHAPV